MPIQAITCPSCGAAGINADTAREYSFCSYCGTALRTKDVLHLDTESMTLGKLKRNALRSFEVRQFGNAKADWERAVLMDRTDHESYWGLVRCAMAARPDKVIDQSNERFHQALSYAPPEVRIQYMKQAAAHNQRAAKIQERLEKRDRLALWGQRLKTAAIFLSWAPVWRILLLAGKVSYSMFFWHLFVVDILVLLEIAAWVLYIVLTRKLKHFYNK